MAEKNAKVVSHILHNTFHGFHEFRCGLQDVGAVEGVGVGRNTVRAQSSLVAPAGLVAALLPSANGLLDVKSLSYGEGGSARALEGTNKYGAKSDNSIEANCLHFIKAPQAIFLVR